MNKFTDAQLIEIKTLKSMEEFKEFLSKENIMLTDEEMSKASSYFESDKLELDDDALDMIAGGGIKQDYEAQAKAEGRKVAVINAMGFCDCLIEQIWARTKDEQTNRVVYYDCKCYSCGETKTAFIPFTIGN